MWSGVLCLVLTLAFWSLSSLAVPYPFCCFFVALVAFTQWSVGLARDSLTPSFEEEHVRPGWMVGCYCLIFHLLWPSP